MLEPTRSPEGDGSGPDIRHRIGSAVAAVADLVSTRVEILREEAAQKAAQLGRGLGALAAAVVTGWIAMLLLAALLVALFTLLFGHLWAGILATLVLYGGAAAGAAVFGWKSLSKVRPLDFPVTRAELSKDWEALADRFRGNEEDLASGGPPSSTSPGESSVDDIEARYRAESE